MKEILLGFFIGALCGAIPLCYGLLTKAKILGIVGIACSVISGVLFGVFEKPPFTAVGVAIVFAVAIFAKNKRDKVYDDHEDDHDIYFDDE